MEMTNNDSAGIVHHFFKYLKMCTIPTGKSALQVSNLYKMYISKMSGTEGLHS